MINLLPPKEKTFLEQQKNLRSFFVLSALFLLSLICLCFILLSIKIYISEQVRFQKLILQEQQTEENFETSKIQQLEKDIKSINKELSGLNSFYQNQTHLTPILSKISQSLPIGANLFTFSFIEDSSKIALSGFCPSRELLFEFKKNLQSNEDFSEITFPLANWVKPSDINFTATIIYNNNRDESK
jgi:Tfp pilus assembly protein PilN